MSDTFCRRCRQPLGGTHLPDCIWEDLVVPSECLGVIEEAIATVKSRDFERGRAEGVAAERARVVAWLRAADSETLVWFAAQRIEQGWHDKERGEHDKEGK